MKEKIHSCFENITFIIKVTLVMTVTAVIMTNIEIIPGLLAATGYTGFLYIGIYHTKSQLPYLGGYIALWITVVEIIFIDCDIKPTINTIEVWAMSIPW